MNEPTTRTGKRILMSIDPERPEWWAELLCRVEVEANEQERERLLAKVKADHDSRRSQPAHRHPFAFCDDEWCVAYRALLAEPQR